MSLGSIFTTVFMDGRRSAYCAHLPQAPIPRNEESDARRAAHPVNLPPTLRYCIASAKHKILCRGQKIRDAQRTRQYLRADSVTPKFSIEYRWLQILWLRHPPLDGVKGRAWEWCEHPYMLCPQAVH